MAKWISTIANKSNRGPTVPKWTGLSIHRVLGARFLERPSDLNLGAASSWSFLPECLAQVDNQCAWRNSIFFCMSSKSLQTRPAMHFTGSTLVWSMGAAAIRNQVQAIGKKSVDINYWYGGLPSTIGVR